VTSRPDLVAVAMFVAADLDDRGYPFAGAVRQVARRLAEVEAQAAEAGRTEAGCGWCGAPLEACHRSAQGLLLRRPPPTRWRKRR